MTTSLKNLSFVIVSDCLTHDTIAVHRFQRKLFVYLKIIFAIEIAIYFSDGAASQYKNRKNFLNLAWHQEYFGIPAEWHFLQHLTERDPVMVLAGLWSVLQQEQVCNDHMPTNYKHPYNCSLGQKKVFPTSNFNLFARNKLMMKHACYLLDLKTALPSMEHKSCMQLY